MFDFIRSLEPSYISKNVEYEKECADGRMFTPFYILNADSESRHL